jgi:hypothetical protein
MVVPLSGQAFVPVNEATVLDRDDAHGLIVDSSPHRDGLPIHDGGHRVGAGHVALHAREAEAFDHCRSLSSAASLPWP